MMLRRYYKKGVKYKYTISDSYLEKLIVDRGIDEATRIDNASYDIILDSGEEKVWFDDCCNRIMQNPRFYLDNLDKLATFKVNYTKMFPEKILYKTKTFINKRNGKVKS